MKNMREVSKEDFYQAASQLVPMDTQVGDTTYNYRDRDSGEVVAVETRDAANPYEPHKYYMA